MPFLNKEVATFERLELTIDYLRLVTHQPHFANNKQVTILTSILKMECLELQGSI